MENVIKGMLNDLCGKDLFSGIWSTLKVNLFDPNSTYGVALDIVDSLYSSAIQPIAIMLMLIYFIIALVDKASSENFTWEQWGRQMCMFLASFYLINHGFDIMKLLFELGLSLSSDVYALVRSDLTAEDKLDVVTKVIETFRESTGVPTKFLKDIVLFIYLLVPWLLCWVMGLVVKIICYTRIIEIYVRAVFAPIALSDFFHSGLQGAGWRFLKSFLAVCIQGAMILVIAALYSALFNVATGSVDESLAIEGLFKFLGVFVALMASACMLMFKSLGLSREMLGVG